MTASPTPPPDERPDLEWTAEEYMQTLRAMQDALDAAERRAAELEAERDEALTQRANFEIELTLALDDVGTAERRAAEERQRADALYIGLEHLSQQVIEERASTARENERLARELEEARRAAIAAGHHLARFGQHRSSCSAELEVGTCDCGWEPPGATLAALAAEPRERE